MAINNQLKFTSRCRMNSQSPKQINFIIYASCLLLVINLSRSHISWCNAIVTDVGQMSMIIADEINVVSNNSRWMNCGEQWQMNRYATSAMRLMDRHRFGTPHQLGVAIIKRDAIYLHFIFMQSAISQRASSANQTYPNTKFKLMSGFEELNRSSELKFKYSLLNEFFDLNDLFLPGRKSIIEKTTSISVPGIGLKCQYADVFQSFNRFVYFRNFGGHHVFRRPFCRHIKAWYSMKRKKQKIVNDIR